MEKIPNRYNLKGGAAFKIIYLLLGFLSFNSLTANSTLLTMFSYAVTLVGAVYFIYRLCHFSVYKRTKGLGILCLFLLSYGIASVVQMRYGTLSNIKAMIWLGMQFFLLYAYDAGQPMETIKKDCILIGWVIIGYTFVFSSLGVGCLILNYHQYKVVNGIVTITGFLWNRLWGFYSDPNYGAVLAVISVLLSVFYIFYFKNKVLRAFFVLNVLVEMFYIAFSDSRTAQIAMLISFAFTAVLFGHKLKGVSKLKPVLKSIAVAGLAVLVSVVSVIMVRGAVVTGNLYLAKVKDPNSVLFYWMDPEIREQYALGVEIKEPEDLKNDVVGRPIEDMGAEGGDISNRRFAIWKSAWEIFRKSPIIGVSFRNIVPFAEDHVPNTYILNNNQAKFESMHNMFVDVLVSQGIVGLGLLILFVLVVVIGIFKNLVFSKNKDGFCCALLCVLIPIFITSLFYSEIIFINTAGGVIFWSALGYLMNLLEKQKAAGVNHV